jgi:hypothetical protein
MGDINSLLSPIDWSFRQQINKEILELKDAIDLMELTNVYTVFHLETEQYIFFSAAYGNFSKIQNILGHKSSLNTNKKSERTPCVLSDHKKKKKSRIQQQKKEQKILKHL